MNCHDVSRMLDPYVDDELSPADAAAVAAHIEQCASCGQRLADRESLQQLVRAVPYYTAPDRLRNAIGNAAPRRSWRVPPMAAWAAGIALVAAIGGAAGLRTRQVAQSTAAMAEHVVDEHVRALTSQRLFDVRSSNQHTVKPWFQGKLDFSPPVADLSSVGFPLVGGRVDSIANRRVAALVFQRREHVIEVFIAPVVARIASTDVRSIRGFHERHWVQGDLSLWAVSDLNERELREFVDAFVSATR
jgi:anti-sigma factor RsiW